MTGMRLKFIGLTPAAEQALGSFLRTRDAIFHDDD
jgi:hypothetical protein